MAPQSPGFSPIITELLDHPPTIISILIGSIVIVIGILLKKNWLRKFEEGKGDVGPVKKNKISVVPTVAAKQPIFVIPDSVQLGENGKVAFWQQENESDPSGQTVSVCSLIVKSCLSGTRTIETTSASKGTSSYAVIEGSVIYCDQKSGRLMRVMAHMSEPLPLTPPRPSKYYDFSISYANARLSHFSRSIMDADLFCVQEKLTGIITDKENQHNDSGLTRSIVSINVSSASNDPITVAEGRMHYASPTVSPDGKWCCYLTWEDSSSSNPIELHIQAIKSQQSTMTTPGSSILTSSYRIICGNSSISKPKWSGNGDLYFIAMPPVGASSSPTSCNTIRRLSAKLFAQVGESLLSDVKQAEALLNSSHEIVKLQHDTDSHIKKGSSMPNPYSFCILANNSLAVLLSSNVSTGPVESKVLVVNHEDKTSRLVVVEDVSRSLPSHVDSICCDSSSCGTFYVTGGEKQDKDGPNQLSELFEVVWDDSSLSYSMCKQVQ